MSKRKLMIAYVCLVGIPLLVLIGIVHEGQRLSAPASVGGNWNVDGDFTAWAGKPCGDLLTAAGRPALSISQSGSVLSISLGDPQAAPLAGTIQGRTLSAGAEDPPSSGNASCSAAIRVDATAERDGEQRTLTGTLRLNTCASCAPVAFRAVREGGQQKVGR
jgi:hypothetical protein